MCRIWHKEKAQQTALETNDLWLLLRLPSPKAFIFIIFFLFQGFNLVQTKYKLSLELRTGHEHDALSKDSILHPVFLKDAEAQGWLVLLWRLEAEFLSVHLKSTHINTLSG